MKFIVTLRNHKLLGPYLIPYMVDKDPGMEFYTIRESLAPDNIKTAPQLYTKPQIEIARLADQCSETSIRKTFGNSKYQNNNDFLRHLSEADISEHIRPYIDARMAEIVDLCIGHDIKIYEKPENMNSIFPGDEIFVAAKKMKPVFNFVRTDTETQYFLSLKYGTQDISLYQMQMNVLCSHPCLIISNKRMFRVENIDAKKLTPFIGKQYISVSKSVEQTYYEKFIKNAIASECEVRATGFRIVNSKATPKAILKVETDLAGNTIFNLIFRYGNMDFSPDSPDKVVVRFYGDTSDYHFGKTTRDMQYEADTEQQAASIFGGRKGSGYYKIQADGNDRQIQRALAFNALNANKERLTEAGIEIELSEEDKEYYTGGIALDFRVSKGDDWFDVYAIVRLEGIEVPFVALKHYILNNIREFRLPDGRIVILPEEWFEKYHDIMASGQINKRANLIQLRSYQYSALENLPLEVDLQERIRRLKNRLSEPGSLPETKPMNVCATLRPYQTTAFNWLKMMRDYGFGACLADDMGLGKTLCTLSLLSESTAVDDGEFCDGEFTYQKKIPSLLLVPKSLIYNWVNEARKFVPQMRILEFTGSNRLDTIKSFPLYDIVIAGYGTLRNDAAMLSKVKFNYIVLDESQYVKNSASKTYQSIMMLDCNHRLALTGTPLENSLTDLWSQINFINPGLLGSLPLFKKRFVTPIERNGNEEASERLRKIIYPFILRRTKQQVLQDLPELMELTVLCDMTDEQKEIYEKEKSSTRNSILDYMDKGTLDKQTVMVLQSLTKLRQIACSPALTVDGYAGGSGKTDYIIGMLHNIISQHHKVLIFSSFVKHLKLIASRLENEGIGYTMLTGSTEDREGEVRKFSHQATPVFLISIKAGGTGLNLTQADYVFIIDPWWNPAVEDQAIARAHRMGQKNAVMVYRFISKDTVEEKIQRFQRKKADLASAFVSESTDFTADLRDEVLRILE